MDDSQEKSSWEKGEEGERAVSELLEKELGSEYREIPNVYLRIKDNRTSLLASTQIDHIVLSIYGIFVIETKNWKKSWNVKQAVKQNENHKKELTRVLGINDDIDKKLFSIVVSVGDTPLSETERKEVCYQKNLIETIHAKRGEQPFTKEKVDSFFDIIKDENLRLTREHTYKQEHNAYMKFLKNERKAKQSTQKTNQSTERKTNQPTERKASQPIEQKTNQPTKQKTNPTTEQKFTPTTDEKIIEGEINQTTDERIIETEINQTTDEKITEGETNQTKSRIKIIGAAIIFLALLSGAWYLFSLFFISNTTPTKNSNPNQNIEPTQSTAPLESDPVRQQFRDELTRYEREVEPKIKEIRLRHWAGERYDELQRLKADAIEDFAKSDYLSAQEGLGQARGLVSEAAAEYARRLAALRIEANEAFADDRAPAAEKAVGQALHLRPDDAEMLALQKRVSRLPEVLDLLRRAGVARNENRPEKEAAALQKVLALDPSRKGSQSRLAKLHGQLKQQRFSGAVRKAQAALDAGDLAAASNQLALAKTISPADKSLAPLQKRLRLAQKEKAFAAQISLGAQAKARDDWRVAATHFQRARQLKPGDKTAVENHDLAQRVVGVTQRLRQMSDREHRLGDKNVLASVAAYLQESESLVEISPGLKKIHAEVTRKAALYRIEVEVVVVSDNATYIVVRGEGQVGETSRRTIRLRPGKRVFEGTRPGYKSKLVTVDLVPGAPAVEVVVICDEKI